MLEYRESMKKYYFIVAIIVLVGVIYYTDLYTYFIRTEVQEDIPRPSVSVPGTPVSPDVLKSGSFVDADLIHKGSGTAKLLEIDGRRIIRLENFNVTNGPDLYVYLSESKKPTGEIKSLDKYLNLGPLKGTSGNQNYEVPEPFSGYDTVVIWCQRYGVLFSYAIME